MTTIPLFDDMFKQFYSAEHRKCPNGITNRDTSQKDSPVFQRKTVVPSLTAERQGVERIFKQGKCQEGSKKSAFLDNHSAKQFDFAFTAIIRHTIHPISDVFKKE